MTTPTGPDAPRGDAPPRHAVPPHAVDLLTARDIREIATALDVRPSKQLGQNFVHDANTVRLIVRRAATGPDDHVLEVGPGLGSLTLALLEQARRVTAVELDKRLAAALPATVAARDHGPSRLRVLQRDALDLVESDLAPDTVPSDLPEVLVANLPYNVATPILLTLLERLPSLDRGVVMVQKEVADRLAAGPGSRAYGAPSVKAAWWAEVTGVGTVSRQVFWPVPNVDSALVRFVRRDPPTADSPREAVFAVIDGAFAQRRKTLRAALATWAGTAARAELVLRAAGVDPSARGETLGIAEFAAIAAADVTVARPDA